MVNAEGPIQSVARAITIMEALLDEHEMGLSELSATLGLGKSTACRLLQTLRSYGLVEQTTSGKFRLGIRLSVFGDAALSQIDIVKEANPYIKELAKISGENVNIAILDNLDVLYIGRIDGKEQLRTRVVVGQRSPAYCTSIGKALLANLPDEALEKVLSMYKAQANIVRHTENTITEVEDLRSHLQKVKEQGFAIDDEELHRGVRCIASPIFNHRGQVIAGVSVSGAAIRLTFNRITELIPYVKSTALSISRKMGFIV